MKAAMDCMQIGSDKDGGSISLEAALGHSRLAATEVKAVADWKQHGSNGLEATDW